MNRHLQAFIIWRREKIDELSKYKGAIAGICAVLTTLALGTIAWSGREEPPQQMRTPYVYYYDLNTSQFFTHKLVEQTPIDAPSGTLPSGAKAGVRAHVFACGSCENDLWVGFLSATRPMTAEELKRVKQGAVLGETQLIGNAETSMWHPAASDEAFELVNSTCPDGEMRVECFPTKQEIAATH